MRMLARGWRRDAAFGVAVLAAFGVPAGNHLESGADAAPTTTAPPRPTLPEPASEDADPVRQVVPRIVAVPDVLTTPEQRGREVITPALQEGGHTVAVESPPGTVCAIVPLQAPAMAAGRWEHNGDVIIRRDEIRRDPPGFGECINAPDGDTFDDGVYQYFVVGATGARSAVATLVVGAPAVPLWLYNDTTGPVCLVLLSPKPADFYDAYESNDPVRRGQAIRMPVAAVEHHARVYGCPPDEPLHSFDIDPVPRVYVSMAGGAVTDLAPPTTVTTTTVPPGTTLPPGTTPPPTTTSPAQQTTTTTS